MGVNLTERLRTQGLKRKSLEREVPLYYLHEKKEIISKKNVT